MSLRIFPAVVITAALCGSVALIVTAQQRVSTTLFGAPGPAGCPSVAGNYAVAITPPSPATSTICVALDSYSIVVDTSNPLQTMLRLRTHFVEGEIPTGVIDGTNAVFRLALAPSPPSSLHLFRNGLRQRSGVDYTSNGVTVTFLPTSVPPPQLGDMLLADYRH